MSLFLPIEPLAQGKIPMKIMHVCVFALSVSGVLRRMR